MASVAIVDRMTDVARASGIHTDELDPAVRPQDDLYRHVNGAWIERDADPRRQGALRLVHRAGRRRRGRRPRHHRALAAGRARHRGAQGRRPLHLASPTKTALEALGTAPIEPLLAEVAAVETVAERHPLVGRFERHGPAELPAALRRQRPGRPRVLRRVPRAVRPRAARRVVLPRGALRRHPRRSTASSSRAMFPLAGPRRRRRAAPSTSSRSRPRSRRSTGTTSPPATARRPTTSCPGPRPRRSPRASTCRPGGEAIDAPAGVFETVVVREPSFVTGLAELLTDEPLEVWKDWLRWQVIRGSPRT